MNPVHTKSTSCDCLKTTEEMLKKDGFEISGACKMLSRKWQFVLGLPLERTDGKKLRRSDAQMLAISHCPWCGKPYGGEA